MKSYLKTIGIAVAVLAIGGGLYYMLVVKSGTLAVTLPKPFEITKQDLAVQSPTPTEDGAVLGESDPYENPLKDIYVNPFAK